MPDVLHYCGCVTYLTSVAEVQFCRQLGPPLPSTGGKPAAGEGERLLARRAASPRARRQSGDGRGKERIGVVRSVQSAWLGNKSSKLHLTSWWTYLSQREKMRRQCPPGDRAIPPPPARQTTALRTGRVGGRPTVTVWLGRTSTSTTGRMRRRPTLC